LELKSIEQNLNNWGRGGTSDGGKTYKINRFYRQDEGSSGQNRCLIKKKNDRESWEEGGLILVGTAPHAPRQYAMRGKGVYNGGKKRYAGGVVRKGFGVGKTRENLLWIGRGPLRVD